MDAQTKKWIWAAFALYCAAMAWLLFGQRLGWDIPGPYEASLNLKPFETVRLLWPQAMGEYGPALQRFAIVNLAGNVALFVPAGLFLPLLFRSMRRWWLFLLTAVLAIAAVECLQLVLRLGSCDIDDLILNVPGTLIGFGVYKIVEKTALL